MPVQVAQRVASARSRAGRRRFGEMPVVLSGLRFMAEAVRAIGRRADGRLCVIFGS